MKKIIKEHMFTIITVVILFIFLFLILNIEILFPTPAIDAPRITIVNQSIFSIGQGTHPNAAVTLVEFGDYQCPYTKQMLPTIHELEGRYGQQVNFVFKHFPSRQHSNAEQMALAAECAREQGLFQEYSSMLFSSSGDRELLIDHAQQIGLNVDRFTSCLDNEEIALKIGNDIKEGLIAGVRGTPTFFINGKKLEGVQDTTFLTSLIDQEVASVILEGDGK